MSGDITREEWFKLPLKLRQRYWRETDYGKHEPNAELKEAIAKARCAVEENHANQVTRRDAFP